MEESRVIALFDPNTLQHTTIAYAEEFRQRILAFGRAPAIFPNTIAKLYAHVSQKLGHTLQEEELAELCSLLPDIKQQYYDQLPLVPVSDLFDETQLNAIFSSQQLEADSHHFQPLNAQVDRLLRISNELRDDKILTELLTHLVSYYEDIRDALCKPQANRRELLTPKAYICGIDLSYHEISYEDALRFLCRTPEGNNAGENTFGIHPGIIINGTYCKPNMIGTLYLETGQENAASKFYQLFNRQHRVAVPATLLKVSHAKINLTERFNGNYQPLLKYYKQNPYMERIIQATMLSEGVLLQTVLELQNVFQHWLAAHSPKTLATLLRECKDPKNLAILETTSGLTPNEQKNIPGYLNAIQKLIKNYTAEKAIAEIPNLLDQLDSYSFCSIILANLLMNATDMKLDNMMLRWTDDPKTGMRKFYCESVDSDQAFSPPITHSKNGHYVTLRCVLLFFKNMNIAFDAKLTEELLEHPAIYYILSWLQLVYEDEQRFEAHVAQKIFTENDLFEDCKPALDRPLKFHKDTLPRMLRLLNKAQQILSVNKAVTLQYFFEKLSPTCAQYYQKISEGHEGSIFDAYYALNHGPTVEELCSEKITEESIHKDDADNKTLTCKEAIAALLAAYSDGEKLDKQFKLLEYIGRYFPFIKELKYNAKQINALLLNIPEFMLPNALDLLLRCGGNVDCKNDAGETILFRILARKDLGTHPHRERLLRTLLTHNTIDVHAVGQNGDTPLTAFIRNAQSYSAEFVQFVIDFFILKRTDLNQMTPSGTALDIAVQLQSTQLIDILVNSGCYNLKDPRLAAHFPLTVATSKTLAVLNPNFHFERAIILITTETPNYNHTVALEGENHQTRYLDTNVAQQLFDNKGEFQTGKIERLGNFDYIKITHNNEVLFYVAGYPSFPGIDIAASRFHRLFDSCTAPDNEIFKYTKKAGVPMALLFCGAGNGHCLTDVLKNTELKKEIFANLDLHNVTQFLFIQFAMGQVNGSTNNIYLLPYQTRNKKRYLVRYLLNDQAFSPIETAANPEEFFDYLQALLPIRLDPQAIEAFLKKNIRDLVKDWLGKLFIHEARMSDLFSASNNNVTLTGVPFEPGTIKKLFVRITALREILEKNANPQFTGKDLLRSARSLYLQHQQNEQTPLTPRRATQTALAERASPRRDTLTKPTESVSPRRGTLAASSTQISPRPDTQATLPTPVSPRRGTQTSQPPQVSPHRPILLKLNTQAISESKAKRFTQKYFNDPSMQKTYSVTAAIDELGQIDNDHAMLVKAIEELKVGIFTTFNMLSFNIDMQMAVNAIIWKQSSKDVALANSLIEAIVNAKIDFTELSLIDCPVLTETHLESLFKNSPSLRTLNLSGSTTFTDSIFKIIARYCVHIEIIILDRTLIKILPIAELPNLKILSAANCIELTDAKIHAANLTELCLDSSSIKTLSLTVKSLYLTKLNVNKCELLEPACLESVLQVTPALRDFQHLKVKAFDMRRYTASIIQEKIISPQMALSLVHNGLLHLYGLTIHDEQLHHIIEAYGKAHKHKEQLINTIDLSGCQNISRKTIAMLIIKIPDLDKVICQLSLEPTKKAAITIKGNGNTITKILKLPSGQVVIFYDNASFEAWDCESVQLLRKGYLDKKITDADVMPNGDIVFCSDGASKILDTLTWKLSEPIQLEAHQGDAHALVKVVDSKWLILGGAHLTIMEITADGLQHFNTTPPLHITSMDCTPNQKIFIAQTAKYGCYIWNIDANTTAYVGKEYTGQVNGLRVLDNNHVILPGIKSQHNIVLSLQPKPAAKKTVLFKAFIERDLLKKQYQLNGHAVSSEPCITAQGDILINLGQSAILARNKCQQLVLAFKTALPTSLIVNIQSNPQHGNHLKIMTNSSITEVEGLALNNFFDFIESFFSADKFRVIKVVSAITICDIPPEDICSYQKMFESFILRSAEFQKSFESTLKTSRSPRPQGTAALKLFSSGKSSENMLSDTRLKSYENLLSFSESSDSFISNRFLKATINHGYETSEDEHSPQDNFSGKTLTEIFNPSGPVTATNPKASPPTRFRKNSFSREESNDEDDSEKSAHSSHATPNASDDESSNSTSTKKPKKLLGKIKAKVKVKLSLFSNKKTGNETEPSPPERTTALLTPRQWEERLDPCALDELTVIMMLMSPANDGPDNYRIKRNILERSGTSALFVTPVVKGHLHCRSFLFCLDNMLTSVHKKAQDKIAKLSPTHLKNWLEMCRATNASVRENLAEDLLQKLKLIQNAFATNPLITKLELLGILDINLYYFYQRAFEQIDPMARYQQLPTSPPIPQTFCEAQTQLDILSAIVMEWEKIPAIREELLQGKTEYFDQLNFQICREEAINNLDFKTTLCKLIPNFKPKRLNLSHFALSNQSLTHFLRNHGENLTYLNLSSCFKITEEIFEAISKYCPNLKQLILANTNIKKVNAILTILELDLSGTDIDDTIFDQIEQHCGHLRSLKLCHTAITHCNSPLNIDHLDLTGCEVDELFFDELSTYGRQLKSLRISSSKLLRIDMRNVNFLATLDLSDCVNLQRILTYRDCTNLKFLFANRCTKLESIVFENASNLVALYANNCALIEVSLSSGEPLPALRIIEVDNNTLLKSLKANPLKMTCFKALNCHSIESILNNILCRRLLDEVVSSIGKAPASRSSSAMTLLLRVKADVVKWAKRDLGNAVFRGIIVPNVDATSANLGEADFYGADFSNAIFAGANLTNTNCTGAKLHGAHFGQLPLLTEHQHPVTLLTHSSDGQFFVSADSNGLVILRNRSAVLRRFQCNPSITAIALLMTKRQLLIIEKQSSHFFDLNPESATHYQPLKTECVHAQYTTALTITSDEKYSISANSEGKIAVINLAKNSLDSILENHTAAIHALAVNKNNLLLASGDDKGNIIIWNLKSYRVIQTLQAHINSVTDLKFTADGNLLISASADERCIKIWNVGKFYRCDRKLQTDESVRCIALSPDNQFIFAGTDYNLFVWNIKSGELVRQFGHESPIQAIDIDPLPLQNDNTWIIRTGCMDSIVRRFIFHDNGMRYQLKRLDLSTQFCAHGMELTGATGLTEEACLFLRQSGARGEPSASMILETDPATLDIPGVNML